jgi:hypothetical protein
VADRLAVALALPLLEGWTLVVCDADAAALVVAVGVGSAEPDAVAVWEPEAPVDLVALAAAVRLAVTDTLAVLAADREAVPETDGVTAALRVTVAVAVLEAGDAETEGVGVGEGITSARDLRT